MNVIVYDESGYGQTTTVQKIVVVLDNGAQIDINQKGNTVLIWGDALVIHPLSENEIQIEV